MNFKSNQLNRLRNIFAQKQSADNKQQSFQQQEDVKTRDDSVTSHVSCESIEIVIQRVQATTPQELKNAQKEANIVKYLKSIGVRTRTDPQEKRRQYYENQNNLRFVGEVLFNEKEARSGSVDSQTIQIKQCEITLKTNDNSDGNFIVSKNPLLQRRIEQMNRKNNLPSIVSQSPFCVPKI